MGAPLTQQISERVHQSDTMGADDPSWGGYVGAGDVDVYVADDSRDLVVRVLDSVRDE